MVFARSVIRTLGRPVAYTAPGASAVQIRVVIKDVDEEMSMRPGLDVISSDATGTVLASDGVQKGGKIEAANGARYEIMGIIPGEVPGLQDLALMRITLFPAAPLFDFSRPVLKALGEEVQINGQTVRVSVNRNGLFQTVDEWENRIEVSRVVVAYRDADAPDTDEGDPVFIDGETRYISQILRDGSGLLQAVL